MYLIVNNFRLVLADPMSFEQFHVARAAATDTNRFAAPLTAQGAGSRGRRRASLHRLVPGPIH